MCWTILFPEKKIVEHVSPFSVWTDGKWDKDGFVSHKIAYDFFANKRCVVVRVTMTIPHQFLPFLQGEVLCGIGRHVA